MSQRCDFIDEAGVRCGKHSQGSLGLLRLCYGCFCSLSGVKRKLAPFAMEIQLHDGGRALNRTIWLPHAVISQLKARAVKQQQAKEAK